MSATAKVRDVFAADRRLTILRLLDESGGAANTAVLEKALRVYALPGVCRESVNADARFLGGAGLVRTEDLRPDLIAVRLTDRGERVARDEEHVAGVARPSQD